MDFDKGNLLKRYTANNPKQVNKPWTYAKIFRSILYDEGLNRSSITVAAALQDFQRKKPWCWPKIETIAKKAHIKSRTTVIKAIRQLEERGHLLVDRSKEKGNSNRYKLLSK